MIYRFLRDRKAATAIEYGLIVAILSLAIVGGVGMTANGFEAMFSNSATRLNEAVR